MMSGEAKHFARLLSRTPGGPGVGVGSELSYRVSGVAGVEPLELSDFSGRSTYFLFASVHIGLVTLWAPGPHALSPLLKGVEWRVLEGLAEEWTWDGTDLPLPLSHVVLREGGTEERGDVFFASPSHLEAAAEWALRRALAHPVFARLPRGVRASMLDVATSRLVGIDVASRVRLSR